MSLHTLDMDADEDLDVVYSDRKGEHCGVGWLEQTASGAWSDHHIGGEGLEVMFLDIRRIDGGFVVACNTRNGKILLSTPEADFRKPWNVIHPSQSGAGKAVAISDSDGDLACTCGLVKGKFGVYWLQNSVDSAASEGPPQRLGTQRYQRN